jgi:hypothetical protein
MKKNLFAGLILLIGMMLTGVILAHEIKTFIDSKIIGWKFSWHHSP